MQVRCTCTIVVTHQQIVGNTSPLAFLLSFVPLTFQLFYLLNKLTMVLKSDVFFSCYPVLTPQLFLVLHHSLLLQLARWHVNFCKTESHTKYRYR